MPLGFLEDVILTRRYIDAYYANQGDPRGWGKSPMRTLANEIEFKLAAEEINASNGE